MTSRVYFWERVSSLVAVCQSVLMWLFYAELNLRLSGIYESKGGVGATREDSNEKMRLNTNGCDYSLRSFAFCAIFDFSAWQRGTCDWDRLEIGGL